MEHTKHFPQYAAEINRLAESHTEALLALYVDGFNDGMKIGRRNTLVGVSIGAVVGVIALCIAGVSYLERKEQP